MFLLLLLSAIWLSAPLALAAYEPPKDVAAALLSRTSKTLYLVYPAGDSSMFPRFFSLPTDQPFTTTNFTRGRKELPALPASKVLSITPVLLPGAKPVKHLQLDKTSDELYVFGADGSEPMSLFRYSEAKNADWMPVDLKPSFSQPDGEISQTTPPPAGRSWGAAFAYVTASTTSVTAPKSTYRSIPSRSDDPALDAYERGDVVAEGTSAELFYFGGMFTERASGNLLYSNSLMTVQLPVERRVGYSSGIGRNKTARSAAGATTPVAALAFISEHDGHAQKPYWPIPEAEFTMTWIAAEGGEGKMVMIGGLASNWSWVGMGQVAFFHLPAQTWEFVDVKAPPHASTGLSSAPGDAADTFIQSRSGHTAVASADGTRIVVYGGYVGNTTTAATPPMLVLELATATWAIPEPEKERFGPPPHSSLFGHAAVMLGDAMLITGGTIVDIVSGTTIRPNTETYLYNTTSSAWMADYDPELAGMGRRGDDRPKSSSKKALAAGLSVGFVTLAALLGLGIWCAKQRQKRRAALGPGTPPPAAVRKSLTRTRAPDTPPDSGVSEGDDTHSDGSTAAWNTTPSITRFNSLPRLSPLEISISRGFSPILEADESASAIVPSAPLLPPPPICRSSTSLPILSDLPPAKSPVDIMRKSYNVARDLTALTDAVERCRSLHEHHELHMSQPVAAYLGVPLGGAAERHMSFVRALPASLRIVPPRVGTPSPPGSIRSLPWSRSSSSSSSSSSPKEKEKDKDGSNDKKGKGKEKEKEKERRPSLVDSIRSVLSPVGSRSITTASLVSLHSQDMASSTNSQHYRGSGAGQWDAAVLPGITTPDADQEFEDPVSGSESVVQVMFMTPKGQLRVVNVGDDCEAREVEASEASEVMEMRKVTEVRDAKDGEKMLVKDKQRRVERIDSVVDDDDDAAYDTAEETNEDNVIAM